MEREAEWGDSGPAVASTPEGGWELFPPAGEARREEMEGWAKEKWPPRAGSGQAGFHEKESGEERGHFQGEKTELEETAAPRSVQRTC